MCSYRIFPYSPLRRDENFLGGGGSLYQTIKRNIGRLTGISRGVRAELGYWKKALPWEIF